MADDDTKIYTYEYTASDSKVYAVRMQKAMADAIQATRARVEIPLLPPNIVPRKIQLEIDQKIIQSKKSGVINIVVPKVTMPTWKLPEVSIPVTKQGETRFYIPVKRTGEKSLKIPGL